MAFTITNAGTNNSTTSSATLAVSSVTASIGDMLVVLIAADNNGSGGASSISSVTDSQSNTYTQQILANRDPGPAEGGATFAVYTSILTTALSAGTVTLNLSPNTTSKAIVIYRIQPGAGENINIRGIGTEVTGAASNHTITATAVTSGDTLICGLAKEANVTFTEDGDTTNGTWSSQYTEIANTGTVATSMEVGSQWKTVTATGDQTWNFNSGTSSDYAMNYLLVYPSSGSLKDMIGRGIIPVARA